MESQSALIIKRLKSHADRKNVEGMARFGINPKNTLGISMPILRSMAKEIGKNHPLALELWDSDIHEARILSSMIDDPKPVTIQQMDKWAEDFDSWDVCDQVCMNLFSYTPKAAVMARRWCSSGNEFVKRAGFAMIASLSLGSRGLTEGQLESFLPLIEKGSTDERNFVRKAVNWALRQIGKRSMRLNREALACARRIEKQNPDSKSARWVSKDAIRELESRAVLDRLKKKR